MSKYSNQKFTCSDGSVMASKREGRRYEDLLLLQRMGEITELETQVEYLLIPKQSKGKTSERKCSYVLDFRYYDKGGELHCEDTKGFRTDAYVIKRKLMLQVHGIAIEEI